MDVTSMLNSASAAANRETQESADPTSTPSAVGGTTACSSAVQTPSPESTPSRRTSGSRTPNRSRTPWDAGGYSLPLTLDTKMATQTSVRPVFYSESPLDSASPKSPKHKFSDSYSSLSSYTSSMNSFTHSRFSSLSTVSGSQTVPTLFTDMSALETRSAVELRSGDNLDSAVSRLSLPDFFSINKRAREDRGLSPTTIAEEPILLDVRRPGSPSDAMLISRGCQDADRMSPQELSNPSEPKSSLSYLVPPEQSKSHKRAVSAPDFAAINGIDQAYPPMPQTLQPTPPPSHQGDRRSSYAMDAISASPPTSGLTPVEEGIKCMYVDNCDTGSQPRKAISHIFGRNKLCTRMIPQHVWVHFCRKHYQRSRYRNAQEYSKLQCELVQKQVRRVQAWSDENKASGRAGVVQDWSLSVRKREQKRLDDRISTGKKRSFREDSEEEDDNDRAVLNGTAVPAWLLTKCSSGYSTEQIEEIVAKLKTEMDQGKLTQIPDIEILPNISTESPDDGKNKMMLKRKTSAGSAHKRSQSVGVGSLSSTPMFRRTSQPSFTGGSRIGDSMHSSPIEKRQRTADFPYCSMGDQHSHLGLPQVPESAPSMRRIQHLPHRPAFSHIRENQTEDSYFDAGNARGSNYTFGGPLPTPGPQRLGQPMNSQLESSNASQGYLDARRPIHQRAHSEMGGFQHNPNFSFRSSSSIGYSLAPQGYGTAAMSYDGTYMRPESTFNSAGPPGYYDDAPINRQYHQQQVWSSPAVGHSSPYSQPRHTRHQSTSAVPQVAPRFSAAEHDMHAASYRSSGPFEAHPVHRRQHSYAPQVYRSGESDQVKALFAERR
ncbi:ORP1 protein [Xylariales sp. AK1849]|nr:ORP1 protein [Xylariales sp. AK1849]